MPTSVREQVLAAAFAAISGISGVPAERFRLTTVGKGGAGDTLPRIVMRDGGQELGEQNAEAEIYTAYVDLELFVTAATDGALGPALNDLYAKVKTALLTDPTFGGLAEDAWEADFADPDIDAEGGHPRAIGAVVRFAIRYWTKPNRPYEPGP